ncbi:MAG: type II 3-dehydroquinate dehydratase [Oscillospiraceae bacterium]|nr:type II 3-dehydroquinate dehydratase [Oscillospiraceae bacterium]
MKIMVLNGPNLNLLGVREPGIYGAGSYADLIAMLQQYAAEQGIELDCRQTNHEGVLVDWIQEAMGKFDGIVINPGAYTHTSIALLDAVKAVRVPTVEVHISDVDARESFRQISYIGMACVHTIKGHGLQGYVEGIQFLQKYPGN